MAIQTGIHTYKNKIGNNKGYKRIYSKNGEVFESLKGGMSQYTFLNAPSCVNVRNNVREFVEAVHNAHVLNVKLLNNAYSKSNIFFKELVKKNVQIIRNSNGQQGYRDYDILTNNNIIINSTTKKYTFRQLLTAHFTLSGNGDKNLFDLEVPAIPMGSVMQVANYTHARLIFSVISKNKRIYDQNLNKYVDVGNIQDCEMFSFLNGAWFEISRNYLIAQSLQGGDVTLFPDNNVSILIFAGLQYGTMVNGSVVTDVNNNYLDIITTF